MRTHVPDYLTPAEAAELLRVQPRTVREWVAAGALEAARVGSGPTGRIRIARAEVLRVLDATRASGIRR